MDMRAWSANFLAEFKTETGIDLPVWTQVLNVVGEAGEFAEAYRRYTGYARRIGSFNEVRLELADTVISSYTAAQLIGFDLDVAITEKTHVIMTRGFRE